MAKGTWVRHLQCLLHPGYWYPANRGKGEHGRFYRRLMWARVASNTSLSSTFLWAQLHANGIAFRKADPTVDRHFPACYTYGRGAQSIVDCKLPLPHLAASSPFIHLVLPLIYPPFTHLHLASWVLDLKEGEKAWGKHLLDWFGWNLLLALSGCGNAKRWLFLHRVILWII